MEIEDTPNEEVSNNPLAHLEKQINLDLQHARMIEYFLKNQVYSYKVIQADSDYYKLNLEQRKVVLGAHEIDVLCKTIVLENTYFDEKYESEYYQRHYMAIVQYTQELHAEKMAKAIKNYQNENSQHKLSNKYFHFRLAENAFDMTGYRFNCITPYLSKSEKLKILIPKNLIDIYPQYFWIGGGEIELKVGMSLEDFIKLYNNRIIVADYSVKKKNK
jgi:prolyl-tRNA editing enzyme YbaK/EbsC (Cys-tRNA(Pro) deacylase)